jgi:hypothetical protein
MKAVIDVTFSEGEAIRKEVEVEKGLKGRDLLDAIDVAIEELMKTEPDVVIESGSGPKTRQSAEWAGWQLVSVDD